GQNFDSFLGLVYNVWSKSNWRVFGELFHNYGRVETTNFNSKRWAFGGEVDFGFYKERWQISLSSRFQHNYLNHITHTDFYRITYFEEAKDGWYKGAGSFFKLGLETAWIVSRNYLLGFNFKIPVTAKGNSLGGAPANVSIAIGKRF
ncbi:MAG: hypothetical protein AAFY41_08665, partial [Bacteroidota bacterium]